MVANRYDTPAIGLSVALLTVMLTANAAIDLEAFAKHAGRTTIKTDDVMMLTRRNAGLESIMKDFAQKLKEKNEREEARRANA